MRRSIKVGYAAIGAAAIGFAGWEASALIPRPASIPARAANRVDQGNGWTSFDLYVGGKVRPFIESPTGYVLELTEPPAVPTHMGDVVPVIGTHPEPKMTPTVNKAD